MSRTVSINDTLTLEPSSFDSSKSSYASVNSSYPIANGYDGSDSSTYAQFVLTTGSNAETYLYYKFDTSNIPDGATIGAVSCSVKAYVSTTNSRYVNTRQVQMTTGTTTKGSSSDISNSATSTTLSVGSWTLSELRDAYVRVYVKRGTSSTTSTSYVARFYGATLSITYSYEGIVYTIMSSSTATGSTVSPASQEVNGGASASIQIETDDLSVVVVTDNGTDVTDQLVAHQYSTGGTATSYPTGYSTSGSISGTKYQSAVGKGSDATASSGNDYCSSQGSTAYIEYSFDVGDIPSNATITEVSCDVKGHCESTSQSSEVAQCQLYSGSTAKGEAVSFTSTSDTVITLSGATWTVAEVAEAKLRFTIGYYGGQISGATFSVTYTVPSSGNLYYYVYTITSIDDDHVILVAEAGPFVPPTEDENYEYYPITISSINATTSPRNGTTRVQEGSNQTITITPTDPQLTLALDNGVDITSQLTGGPVASSYTVNSVSGASYGFSLNANDYYESTNQGISSSVSVARVNLSLGARSVVTFTYINYAEATYDYGIFGKVDTALGTSTTTDSSNIQLACSTSALNSSSPQTLTYEVESGEHYIDVKYYKDQYTDSNNDSLQFKVEIEAIGASGAYEYTLSNVQQKHSLIFIFGDVDYYFLTSGANEGVRLYPDGQTVALEGQSYSLVIVPDSPTADITLTDNNVDVTSSLEYESVVVDGSTVVNYTYKLTNIVAAHTLVVTCSTEKLYIKLSGTWTRVTKIYIKTNGRWEESTPDDALDTTVNYYKAN